MSQDPELAALRAVSARLGRNPLLVQAATGNTSLKQGRDLWIKASGKWLAQVALQPESTTREASFVRLDRETVCRAVAAGRELEWSDSHGPRPSVEAAMHAVLPHRVLFHVHSVNAIAYAVRSDGENQLARRLSGLNWHWIPYAPSGLALAQACARVDPACDVLILGNHGLVVGAPTCSEAEELLMEVERRVAIRPRSRNRGAGTLGYELAEARIQHLRLPLDSELHALANDAVTLDQLRRGVMVPCQAMILGEHLPVLSGSIPLARALAAREAEGDFPEFWIVEGRGVLVSERLTPTQNAVLKGLLEVTRRIEAGAPIRYLEPNEVADLLSADAHRDRVPLRSSAISLHRDTSIPAIH